MTLFSLMAQYRGRIAILILLTIAGNGLALVVPQIIAHAIDQYHSVGFSLSTTLLRFAFISLGIFFFALVQGAVQVFLSEAVARDLRTSTAAAISHQEFASIQVMTTEKLLTNLTSDIDAIKGFVAQALAALVSSVFLIIGAAAMLIIINTRLALAVLLVIPLIGTTFYFVLSRVRALFKRSQEAIDRLNKVITESIFGAPLVRLLRAEKEEYVKFNRSNEEARGISMQILRIFASMIPVITFLTNIATITILLLGGYYVIQGSMTLGQFTAFTSYVSILIFPIFVIGFSSNAIAQASASYRRVAEVLNHPVRPATGTTIRTLTGAISLRNISLTYGERTVLDDISFDIPAGSRTAIIGPTAAGKTQLLYLMTGLTYANEGSILYDDIPLQEYEKQNFYEQIGFVFQDSIIFNLSLRENIAFSDSVQDVTLTKAIETAELEDLIAQLPKGLDTILTERGTSFSGGQKQRVMLARALAQSPSILFLDDFTARVDYATEKKILANLRSNYPALTLVSVTQKIAPIEEYDQILLLMEGELLAHGTHDSLMASSPEYVQIYNSQQSTETYEASS